MIQSQVLRYFSRLSSLPLTLSENIWLVNSQLIPAVTYRFTAHPPPPRGPLPRWTTTSGAAWQRRP